MYKKKQRRARKRKKDEEQVKKEERMEKNLLFHRLRGVHGEELEGPQWKQVEMPFLSFF